MPDGLEGERVDAAIARMFGFSRTKAAELAASGKVQVDGAVVGKSERVNGGAWLEVEMPAPAAPVRIVAEPVEGMEIVHDDDDIVVIVKPVGVAAHPSPGWTGTTVIGGLAAAGYRISTSGAAERQGIVHRLDVGTSGLMVVAKSERAYTLLKAQFKERVVDKRYHALVQGHPDPMSGTIDAPIGRHPNHDYKWAVTADGKPSVTHYDLIEAFRSASLLDIKLETGRTHQIRVHMSAHRHPCVGDLTYGADPTLAKRLGLTRQWLHAVRLGFEHPSDGRWVEFESTYPRRSAGRAGQGEGGEQRMSAGERGPRPAGADGPAYEIRVATDPADREACFAVRKEVFVVEQRVPEDIEYDGRGRRRPSRCSPSATTGCRSAPDGCCTGPTRPTGPAATRRRLARPARRDQGRPRPRRRRRAGARHRGRGARARPDRRSTCTRRRTPWASTSGSGTRPYGPEFLDAGIPHRSMRRAL